MHVPQISRDHVYIPELINFNKLYKHPKALYIDSCVAVRGKQKSLQAVIFYLNIASPIKRAEFISIAISSLAMGDRTRPLYLWRL